MMVRRQHSSELRAARWACDRCSAGGTSKNAQALAARHHDQTGHRTWVEITNRTTYGAMLGERKGPQQRSML